jgi:hypothetical protein
VFTISNFSLRLSSKIIQMNSGSVSRTWESGDFCVSKIVLVEGQIDLVPGLPRFGAKGTVVLDKNWEVEGKIGESELTGNLPLSRMLSSAKSDENCYLNFR